MLAILSSLHLLFNGIACLNDVIDTDDVNWSELQPRSLVNSAENLQKDHHRTSVEGAYKGSYSAQYDGKHEDGNFLLFINHLSTLADNKKDANDSQIVYSLFCKSRLMILNSDYQRHTFQFWYGFYDIHDDTILLSDHNFTFNSNVSFVQFGSILNKTEVKRVCPQLLRVDLSAIKDVEIIGNFTDNCKYDAALSSFAFDSMELFGHKANSYGIISLCAVSGIFYFLLKQYEYSVQMARVVKLSFISLYLQFIYNGIICFVHFDAAMNVELLFSTFLMITFICIMNANLYQRMMRSIWCLRYPQASNHASNIKILNFMQILSFVSILFLSQYIMVGAKYSYLIYFMLSSDWFFQILHNIKTGHILSWKLSVVVASTCAKLFFPLYIYGCPANIAHHETNYIFCMILVVWCNVQILFLYIMDVKTNARWFIPPSLKPPHYKYHRAPNYDIDDHQMKEEQKEEEEEYNDNDSKQCAICLESINWKKEYEYIMITPCNHYFHDNCLTQWMFQRLTCPTCRAHIPPKL